MQRRDFVTTLAAAGLGASQLPAQTSAPRKGRLKQGAMRQNFDPKLSFDEMCRIAAEAGVIGIDNTGPQDWPALKKYGLICTMAPTGGVTFEDGLIRKEKHDDLVKSVSAHIDLCASEKIERFISVGGMRKGMQDEQAWENAASLLNRLKPRLEDKGITMCLEIMNNRYTEPRLGRVDQICSHVSWGVELCKRVNSPRFKLLYDIYHVQVMDGNVVANMRDNIQHIAHFHTGGVPGRREIDDSQELNYRFIAQAILDTGFAGVVSHEYSLTPGKDTLTELKRAVSIMDV